MPPKKPGMTPEQQSEAFRKAVRELIDAGELSDADAEKAFERITSREVLTKRVKPPS